MYIYHIYIYIHTQYEKCMIFIIAINPASLEVGLVGHYGGNGLDRLATGSTGCCGLRDEFHSPAPRDSYKGGDKNGIPSGYD